MKPPLLSRKLAFERMEDRLALSATMGGDFIVHLDYLNANQGGFVDFDVTIRAADVASFGDADTNANFEFVFSNTPPVQAYFPGSLNGNFQGDLGVSDTDQIAPIAQPPVPSQQLGGTIELANIFLPITRQSSTITERQLVQSQNTSDASQLSVVDSQVKEPSFARGRDMYFEVASLSAQGQSRGRSTTGVSQDELIPVNYSVSAGISKSILEAPELRGRESRNRSVPNTPPTAPLPQPDAVPGSTPAKGDLLRATEKAAGDPATRNAQQEQAIPAANELSAASAHDAALAELWSDEFMAEEVAISLRSNEGGQHFAAWPTLAVLVGGGIIARQRRASRASANFPGIETPG